MCPREAEYPRPDHTIVHISDTHLLAGDARLFGGVDSGNHLADLLERFERTGRRPDAIVFTGDLADRGEPEAYARLREVVDPVADRLGTTVVWAMGNHDDRAAFRAGLLDEAPSSAPVDRVIALDGLRLIVLDSTVPGAHHGAITDEQLRWLADELAVPAPDGTILAMHHPPVPSVLDLAVSVELHDQARLARVLQGTDVRSIIAGHLHYSSMAVFAGIPVSVASASCYTQDLLAGDGTTMPRDGARGFNLVHVYPSTVLHTVVPLEYTAALEQPVDPVESARRLEAAGVRIPESARSRAAAVEFDTFPDDTRPIQLVGAG